MAVALCGARGLKVLRGFPEKRHPAPCQMPLVEVAWVVSRLEPAPVLANGQLLLHRFGARLLTRQANRR